MYMKKLLLIMLMLVAVSTSSTTAVAQTRSGNQDREERLFIAKMKVIQEELKLDEEQTEKFAVIYRNYNSDMKKLFKKHKRKPLGELTMAQALKMTNDHIDMKIALLKLQKGYYKQYANVLTPEQLLRLDRAEQRIQFEIMKQGKNRKERPRRQNNNND